MKFKKTKLTALAMSVLMAASTITSVTWAADLFTDGAPAEVAVEAPAVISDTETEEVVVDDVLLSDALIDADVVLVYADPAGTGKTLVKFYPIYKKADGTTEKGSLQCTECDITSDILPATCQKPQQARYLFTYEKVDLTTPYVDMVGGKEKIDHELGYISRNVIPAECLRDGASYSYYGCIHCNQIDVGGTLRDPKTVFSSSGADILWEGSSTLPDKDGVKSINGMKIKKETLPMLGHNWGEDKYTVVPAVKGKDTWGNDIWLDDKSKSEADFAKDANCKIVNGKITGHIDDDRDAYYYVRHYCTNPNCKEFEQTAVVTFYYANMKENEVVCVAGTNVHSFVTRDDEGFLVSWEDRYKAYNKAHGTTYGINMIPLTECEGAILDDCSKGGSYSVKSQQSSSTSTGVITLETVSVPKGHAFSNIFVHPTMGDQIYLLKDRNNTKYPDTYDERLYTVDYNENKDVIKAYSNNCTKEAKYQLYHFCLNDNCTLNKDKVPNGEGVLVGTTQVTEKGTVHAFKTWTVDPSKTVYTKIDEKQHKEHYIEISTCTRCGFVGERDSKTKADAIKDHVLAAAEIKDTRVEPTCGKQGSYKRGYTCACGYLKEDSVTTVTIPCTDKHDFGTNEAFIEWSGEIKINGISYTGSGAGNNHNLTAAIVRKCNVCGKTDSNGINGITLKPDGMGYTNNEQVPVKVKSVVDAKKDPATGVTYACSTAHATVYVDWIGTVDGKVVELNSETATNAVKENVPYYSNTTEYQARTAHTPGAVKIDKRVEPTADKDGSYDEVIYCTVCGDEVSRNTVTIPKDIQVTIPTVTATAVNYNTVNVSWTPVEGATSYRLYYRSADLGITTWHRVRTLKGTSFTHSGLTTGARYRYTVRAEVNDKLGDYSKTGSVARPLPAAPEMKSVTAVSNGTKVTWSKVDGADGYIIFRKTTGAFTRVGAVSKGSKVTWTDKKPVSGATYKVRAYRTVNNVNYKGAFSAAK